jgi:hypothetical protein
MLQLVQAKIGNGRGLGMIVHRDHATVFFEFVESHVVQS